MLYVSMTTDAGELGLALKDSTSQYHIPITAPAQMPTHQDRIYPSKDYCWQDWVVSFFSTKESTPIFLIGKSCGQRSQAGYSPWGHKRVRLHGFMTKTATTMDETWPVPSAGYLGSLDHSVNMEGIR